MKLDEKSDRREYRRETGGVTFINPAGPERNQVPIFDTDKIAPRTYRD